MFFLWALRAFVICKRSRGDPPCTPVLSPQSVCSLKKITMRRFRFFHIPLLVVGICATCPDMAPSCLGLAARPSHASGETLKCFFLSLPRVSHSFTQHSASSYQYH
ncbi:uncharacterized protein EDB91DRAFT_606537 [Suillus paluster]|uniref:uncharacterized protein n=1 Tax=Suillus paluster TaxID=48578 RepID=UPI001B87A1B1|nr:uncharacterized protein EDB91DRAFT_606537 [Suillus paluster]KAG1751415.1 hypothetical protein EDB91DRAFT_606537 [Suillus paluster]